MFTVSQDAFLWRPRNTALDIDKAVTLDKCFQLGRRGRDRLGHVACVVASSCEVGTLILLQDRWPAYLVFRQEPRGMPNRPCVVTPPAHTRVRRSRYIPPRTPPTVGGFPQANLTPPPVPSRHVLCCGLSQYVCPFSRARMHLQDGGRRSHPVGWQELELRHHGVRLRDQVRGSTREQKACRSGRGAGGVPGPNSNQEHLGGCGEEVQRGEWGRLSLEHGGFCALPNVVIICEL